MTTTNEMTSAPEWFGEAARNVSYQPIIQAFFMLVYAVWWIFAFPIVGTIAFAVVVIYAGIVVLLSVRDIRHSLEFANIATPEGKLIGKRMGVVMGISYGALWIAVIVLGVLGLWRWVLPVVALIIGIHFLPLAAVFSRRIDFALAPLAIVFAIVGLVLAAQPDISWQLVYGVTGIGSAITTGIYATYILRGYRTMCRDAGVTR